MREIKFRAWGIENKKMLEVIAYGDCGYLNYPEGGFYSGEVGILYEGIFDKEFLAEGKYELMQYTGLKDKNYKEIYEGDIVAFNDELKMENTNIAEIIFDVNRGSFIRRLIHNIFGETNDLNLTLGSASVLEVIGNKYENPELLK